MAADGYEAAGELLRALSAPLRIGIVTELAAGPRCVHELVETLGAPQPLRRLAALDPQIAAAWRRGDPRAVETLAALELRGLGLRP